jgi:hypothetical protein
MTAAEVHAPRLVRRRYGRTGHGYTLDGDKVDGVTTILNALPKQLKQWAADCAANFAVEHWDELAEQPITKRLDRIRYAHRDVVNRAAIRGTDIHNHGENLVHGRPVDVPDEYRGPVEAYARFLDDWKIEPVATETPLANTTYRYGGTADLWATIGLGRFAGMRALVDLKTGKDVYESTVLQLAAYRYADLWQPDGPASEEPLPEVDGVFIAHIMPDAVRLLPVVCGPEQFRQFLYVQQTSRWLALHGFRGPEPLIGDALQPEDIHV